MVRNTQPELRDRAEALLEADGLRLLLRRLRPGRPRQASRASSRGGYWLDDRSFGHPYGMINTEPRIASYIGIARGQLPPEHYYRIFRTLPAGRGRQQKQVPRGRDRGPTGA